MRPSPDPSEFYVGYLPEGPPRLMAGVRRLVLALVLVGLAVAAALAAAQGAFDRSRFEFGAPRAFVGRVELEPVPTLVVARPNTDTTSRYLVVLPFKHGAGETLAPYAGQVVRLEATLVHRDDATMLELVPDSLAPAEDAVVPLGGAPAALGERTLVGEIVDSKCFLGVMKPGSTKPHRACASLCIRGGIPPVLCVRDERGLASYWLLVDRAGEPVNAAVLPYIAEPVRLTGAAWSYGDQRVLRIDPATIERL